MKPLIAACLLGVLGSSTVYSASSELKTLDENQAILTKQLNVAEKIGEAHGRYVILRDQYVQGNQGLLKLGESLNTRIAAWLKKWPEILQPLATQGWVDTVQSAAFQQSIDRQNIELDKLTELSRQFESTIRTGARLSSALPKLDVTEFQKLKQGPSGSVVFLQSYAEPLRFVNSQFSGMQKVFSASEAALQIQLIPQLRNFSFRVTNLLKLITTQKRLSFPELSAQLQVLEKMLGTMEQLNPIQATFSSAYEKGLQMVSSNRLPEIEDLIKGIELGLTRDYAPYENKPQYDQERVRQSKALVQMQLNDLKNNLRNSIAAMGGRNEMLGSYIRAQSTRGTTSPLTVCRSTSNRSQYDCNLFRAQVVPFLPRLRELDEAVLGQIVKTLQQVYRGPLASEAQP